MRLEVCFLIGMNDVGDAKMRNELVDRHANYLGCLFVLQYVRLNGFNKVIDDGQNVSVPALLARKRGNDVHSYAFK